MKIIVPISYRWTRPDILSKTIKSGKLVVDVIDAECLFVINLTKAEVNIEKIKDIMAAINNHENKIYMKIARPNLLNKEEEITLKLQAGCLYVRTRRMEIIIEQDNVAKIFEFVSANNQS